MKQLLQHLKTYLQLHHDQNDGGVHINLIARISDELEKFDKPDLIVGVWLDGNLPCFNTTWVDFPSNWAPGEYQLYARPPTQQKPLSDDQIIEIGIKTRSIEKNDFLPVLFARAIEQAHGIGG